MTKSTNTSGDVQLRMPKMNADGSIPVQSSKSGKAGKGKKQEKPAPPKASASEQRPSYDGGSDEDRSLRIHKVISRTGSVAQMHVPTGTAKAAILRKKIGGKKAYTSQEME